jgi:hypothetical protein
MPAIAEESPLFESPALSVGDSKEGLSPSSAIAIAAPVAAAALIVVWLLRERRRKRPQKKTTKKKE